MIERKESLGEEKEGGSFSSSFESRTKSLLLNAHTPKKADKDKETYVIGITGGTASGKTSLAKAMVSKLGQQSILLLSLGTKSFFLSFCLFSVSNLG
jgi:polynucleotide 5'-kinase involved in rRNA processing